jgi:hypothetical protein
MLLLERPPRNKAGKAMLRDSRPGTPGAPCFVRGTRILTPAGAIVVTASGVRRRVTWVGHRRLDLARHPRPHAAAPVRISRGAIGNGIPSRDLLVSPDHALMLNETLIPARALVNGATVLADLGWARVEYVHVALDAPDVLLAEAAPAESFPARGVAAAFEGASVLMLHPGFADPPADPADPRPRASAGPAVREARRTLLARARHLGHALTRAPDLHLLADGTRLNPTGLAGSIYRFAIPPATADLRIVSRAGVPAETDPDSEDRRRLGVKLGSLALRIGDRWRELPAADATLTEGFHPPEGRNGTLWRWTDGHARLPAVPGNLTALDLHVLGAQAAWARAAPPDAPMHRSA